MFDFTALAHTIAALFVCAGLLVIAPAVISSLYGVRH